MEYQNSSYEILLSLIFIAEVFATVTDNFNKDYSKGFIETIADFIVNNLLWGNFIMKEECYTNFGCSTFFVPFAKKYYFFASINLERIPIVSDDGNVSG